MATYLIKVCKLRKQQESVDKTYYNIGNSPSSPLYSFGHPTLKGRGLHRMCEYQGVEIIGSHLGSAHPKDAVSA